ncbi:hypothetical protein MHYP_G00322280 [Metynnis hypsauchen]
MRRSTIFSRSQADSARPHGRSAATGLRGVNSRGRPLTYHLSFMACIDVMFAEQVPPCMVLGLRALAELHLP